MAIDPECLLDGPCQRSFPASFYVAHAAAGIICGLSVSAYELALDGLAGRLQADVEKLDV